MKDLRGQQMFIRVGSDGNERGLVRSFSARLFLTLSIAAFLPAGLAVCFAWAAQQWVENERKRALCAARMHIRYTDRFAFRPISH